MTRGIESWEDHAYLHDREDYPALVALCNAEVVAYPNDLHAHERLGQALVLNGEFDSAIRAMSPVHRQHPDIESFAYIILDALYAAGKTEHDFGWSRQPKILRLGAGVYDTCYDYLQPKRKPRSAADIYCNLMFLGYIAFTETELLHSLAGDERFNVVSDDPWDSEISVVRRSRRRTKR
jgi:hypothetical protein